jgi:hypothetical protein
MVKPKEECVNMDIRNTGTFINIEKENKQVVPLQHLISYIGSPSQLTLA